VTFTAASKGAFRVDVIGIEPSNVASLLLTGHGDEQDLELAKGAYSANVTDIGSGARYSLSFDVDDSPDDIVLRIEADRRLPASSWRSIVGDGRRATGKASSWVHSGTSKGPGGASELKIRQQTSTTSGWRAFTGSRLVNADVPRTLKILRLGSWAEHPVIRMDFTTRQGAAVHCLVPLFSGGTLMRWGEDDCLTEMIPCEPKSAALVGSLCNSLRHEMSAIVQWASGSDESEAMHTIMQSRDDPWAAVAAGLLLVGSGRVKQVGSWPQRFAARHPWLSDFAVLGAWWKAANQPQDEKGCLALLKQARERGHIYFWNSFPLSEQLLTALSSGAKSTELRAEARKELGRWKRMQSGAVRVGAFPIWVTAT